MSSQVISADKRYRISLLLDTYGNQLTEKQRTFLRLYFEDDLSYGEIASNYSVSRQAIFDSVRHGEEALETLEGNLGLIASGWAGMMHSGLTLEALLGELRATAALLAAPGGAAEARQRLEALLAQIEPEAGLPEDFSPVAKAAEPQDA